MDYSNLKIAVFGGSKPVPGESAYWQASDPGKLLGKNRTTVMPGGYLGVMEAVSRGPVEIGGQSIGGAVSERQFELITFTPGIPGAIKFLDDWLQSSPPGLTR
jgi:predicted Rossmann-fold nucleotide-binding protein